MNTTEIASSPEKIDSFLRLFETSIMAPNDKYKILLDVYKSSKNEKILEFALTNYPERLDAYYYKMLNQKNYDDQYQVGKQAVQLLDNPIDNEIYNYLFLLNFSIAAFYSGNYNDAYIYGNKLSTKLNLPAHIKTHADRNMAYFKEKHQVPSKTFFKNVECNYLPNIVVVDNFYKDPMRIREFALQQQFEVKGNYPGRRTVSLANTDEMKAVFEKILNRKIIFWPDSYNGSFQYTTKELHSWVHRDQTDLSAVVFLTPDPPLDGGTYLYRHNPTGEDVAKNSDMETTLSKDSYNMNAWTVSDFVGNKFNRVIIFNGRVSHKSGTYFGEDLYTGRLFQTFFFNVEK